MSLGAAVYILACITFVLGFMRLYYAWQRVDWAAWWASTRTSENTRGPEGANPRVASGVRRVPPPESDGDRPAPRAARLSPNSPDARSSR